MRKIYLLLLVCCISIAASATQYFPISVSAPYGGTAQTICQGSGNTIASVTYTVCGTSVTGTALVVTPTWYLNGTAIYTGASFSAAAGGTVTLPASAFSYSTSGDFTGTNGLYCQLSWTGASPVACGSTTSVSGATTEINVNPTPAAITGTSTFCAGTTSTLSDGLSGGIWSSSNSGVGNVNFSTGVVTGVAAGTAIISYTMGTGCRVTTSITINPTPAAITGAMNVCLGAITTIADPTVGGTWSSGNTAVATIGIATGVITSVSVGTATITYTLPAGCYITAVATVNPVPSAITGAGAVCISSTTTLSDATASGTWSSSSTGVATIGSATGVVAGVSAGTSIITYKLPTGCQVTSVETVNPLPVTIAGSTVLCEGTSATVSDATAGGTWSSSNTSVALIGTAGDISGVSAGTSIISYTLGTGCIRATTITVNPIPASITGIPNLCIGSTSSFSDATTGGTWSSSTTTVATINSTTGVATGAASGTSLITYKLPTGCINTTTVTVNSLPTSITGTASVCLGLTTTLGDATTGGNWASGNTAVATVDASGVVTSVATGTATITYTLGTGCYKTVNVTVNPLPTAITGTATVCAGSTTNLSNATTGGTWSSSNTTIATVGSSTGIVSGVAAGNAVITYTLATGCIGTQTVTVNPLPVAITGMESVCAASTTTLSDASTGGTWTSSTASVATADASSGAITGVAAGTSVVSYILPTGCKIGAIVTVNALPATITGTVNVCAGATTTLTDVTSGGTWSSSNTAVATISPVGIVSGVSAGTSNITYVLSTGCVRATTVTVNLSPAPITGIMSICSGGNTTTLSDATTGGIWSASAGAIATVDFSTGVVTSVSTGVAPISYTLPSGCRSVTSVTVNLTPSAIAGATTVCVGSLVTLTDATSGGTWSSSNASVATVGVGTGVVTGLTAGTANISYSLGSGCSSILMLTVNPVPAAIAGSSTVCIGSTVSLSNTTVGGTWISSNVSVASVSSTTGVLTGVAVGTTTITYKLTTGCQATTVETVNSLPVTITGIASACIGFGTTLSDATTGGVWSSSNTSVATIGTSGEVSGISAGTSTISYTVGSGCARTVIYTVNPLPAAITGPSAVCLGLSTTLSDATTGGTWSSGSPSVIGANATTGVITGNAIGSAIITYKLSTGCLTTTSIIVNPLPAAITGTTSVCLGLTTTLADATASGTWSSSNSSVATVDVGGVVTGVAAGNAVITYTLPTGCISVTTVTVNPLPPAIGGATTVCAGSTAILTDATVGGTWSSSNTAIATIISGSGIATGVAGGVATITYKFSTGCLTTTLLTVNPLPSAIAGATHTCIGSTTTLADGTSGGTWTSSNIAVATIDGTAGVVTGIASGTATITYTISTGCRITTIFTVNPLPGAIAGTAVVCQGLTTTLTDGTVGGVWSSSDATIASVSTSGVVTGVAAGNATVSYMLASGCYSTVLVTVNQTPAAITGTNHVCAGTTTTLGESVTGGAWSSSNTTVASIGSGSGIVSGLAVGTTIVSYTMPTGCKTTLVFSVTPLPVGISGVPSVCTGSTTNLSDGTVGGTWSSSDITVASITAGGVVSGVNTGNAEITYTLGTGCTSMVEVTVNPTPAPVSGTGSLCLGSTITVSDIFPGGVWSSSNTSVATVGLSSGVVTGMGMGTSNITYTLSSGCSAVAPVTVDPLPAAITGTATVCAGSATTLSDASVGGTWSSSDLSTASIGSGTGIVIGVAPGTATISYTLATGCVRTTTVSVVPVPAGIVGTTAVCVGATTNLTDATPGGTWTSGSTFIATVNVSTGVATGVSSGTTIIDYTLATGCSTTTVLTVNPTPAVITGTATVCAGTTTTLSDGTYGGTWSSVNTAVATIDASGIVTGVATGTSVISYANGSGCARTITVTVNSMPSGIIGTTIICLGSASTLADPSTGGTWSSSTTSVATIGVTTGIVSSVSAGTSTISYTAPGGCRATTVITVNPLPSPISGTTNICNGSSTTLSDAVTGGIWSSGAVSVASVGSSSGIVTGLSTGTSIITYYLGTGCSVTTIVTVTAVPVAISGPTSVCAGSTMVVTDATSGGAWSSSDLTIATVTSGGVVAGIAAGTANISYTLGSGCSSSVTVTVNPLPSAISGTTTMCIGNTTTLTDAISGGLWTSSNTAIATVDLSSGIVTGNAAGLATITYTLGTGCKNTVGVVVHPLPASIIGATTVCQGSIITMSNTVSGGTWSSSDVTIADVGVGTGIVQGINVGAATITYAISGGCYATKNVTVNPAPTSTITGDSLFCVGTTTALADTLAPGGTWSSGNTAVATAGLSSGAVYGVSAGTVNITYTLAAGCSIHTTVTVNPAPSAIIGIMNVCIGSTATLHDAVSGGTWTSGDTTVGTIDLGTGTFTGLSAGTSLITYNLGAGCLATTTVTVNPAAAAILGSATVCAGSTTTLTDSTADGIWMSSNTSVAAVDLATGIVTAVAQGADTITYTILGTGCSVSKVITVNPLPGNITGTAQVCQGSSITLMDTTIGGVWTSVNTSIALVGAGTGIVEGTAPGIDTIFYTLPTGCSKNLVIAVNPLPNPISGVLNICESSTTTLTDGSSFGTWTSSNTSVASIGSLTGLVTGLDAGTSTITYGLGTGCIATVQLTVNALPSGIMGDSSVCLGATIFLDDAIAGGAWSSNDTTIATIDAAGNVIGRSVGATTITYTISSGCYITTGMTVNPVPSNITGSTSVCAGFTTTLSDTLSSGVWTSSTPTVAAVDSGSGVVTGVSAGLAIITYTSPGGCLVSKIFTVNAVPAPITGTPSVCAGSVTSLSDVTTGGNWSSTNTSVATVDGIGNVTGITANTDTIKYSLSTGCFSYVALTVNPLATSGVISGSSAICQTTSETLSDTAPGGIWSSSDTAIVSIIDSTGVATGINAGTATITYTVINVCGSATTTTSVLVNPSPYAGTITGSHIVCVDYTATLSDATTGGVWSSSNNTVAIVSTGGTVLGLTTGIDTIFYSVTSICGTAIDSFVVTVSPSAPLKHIAIHSDTAICSNTLFQNFSADTTSSTGLTFAWTAENAQVYAVSANKQSALISFPTPGESVVKLTTQIVSTGCAITDSFIVNVSSDVSPDPDVKYYGSELVCTDNTADTYKWGYDDVITLDSTLIVGETHQDYYLPAPDFANKNYWVITTHGDCQQKSYYNLPTLVSVITNNMEIRLFPNPADSKINIEITGISNLDNINARVVDMFGKDVQSTKLVSGKGSMNVSQLPSGVYSVTLTQGDTKIGSRIFIKN